MDQPQPENHLPPEEYLKVTDKVRTGEYFREAKTMYDTLVHDSMSERYLYIVITATAIMIFLAAFVAMRFLYPLQTDVPFAIDSVNMTEEIPRIRSLLEHKGEDPNVALVRFLARNYVSAYEEYNIDKFDRNVGTIKSQSSPEVFDAYQQLINPKNPESPLTLYQRHSKRTIDVVSSTIAGEGDDEIEVIFEATVVSRTDSKKTRWMANITFNYKGIELDEDNDKITPYEFQVTGYSSKRIQDVQ